MADKQFLKGAITGVVCASLVLGGGYVGLQKAGRAGSSVLSDVAVTQKISYLENIIDQNYLDEADENSLKEGLYTGLLYGLGDPYSRYYTEEEYEEETRDTEGSYSGIGVSITQNTEGGILVVECYEGGPADVAGVKKNDVITAVDGTDVTDMTPSQVSKMIREKEDGTSVLTVYHQEQDEPEEITVTISDVELPTVSYEMLEDSIGYLKITEFTMVTPQQFADAYKDLQAKGMEKLIVDLRDNPGGVLSSVCDVLRQILPEGLIVYTEDKYGEKQEMKCDGDTPIDIPFAVLVNENSASASEIFAGAVKDYGIGTIVGTTTYGKGIVQSLQKLSDGSAVKLTTARYYTPKGNNIHKVGITPDVEVKLDASLLNKSEITHEEDNQLQTAIQAVSR
ncbi:S41 family peptidase [Blautia sp. HCP3S3_H10_1]|uniref:S41 family peptidase n=1 Tax=unclassified Blautia TaxID=2648079 RepID=UPI003F923FA3|nr:S41 family peptidase [Clostridia bacterium]